MNKIKGLLYRQRINLIYSCLILFVFLIHLPELYQPCILHDEYGVWADAAHLAGLDWSGITSISTYYSFGYSFLLVPLFWFVKEPVAMYRVAILMNALMYVASYWISVKFARKFFKEEHPYVVETICFVATFYASNLFYVNMGWAESLLVLMFWVLLYTIYRYFETDKWWLAILVSIEAVYMYMIHMRTLGVVIAVILSLLIYEVSKKKINWKNALLFTVCMVAMFLIATGIKQLLIDNLYCWNNNRIASANDYSGQVGKIARILSLQGVKDLIKGVCGKVFFFIVATCGIGGYGMIKYGTKVKEEKLNAEGITAIFALLSLVGMIGVTTIFMIGAPRIDTILYGRYFNFTIPPMIVAGMYYLYVNKPKLRSLAIVVAVTLISAIGIKGFLDSRSTFQYLQSVGVSIFYDYATDKFDLISSTLLAVEMAVFLWVCSRIKNNKAWIGIIVVIVGLWGYNSHVALYNYIIYPEKGQSNLVVISDAIKTTEDDIPVYFVQNEDESLKYVNYRVEDIQYYLQDRKIQLISRERLKDISGDYFVVACSDEDELLDGHDVVAQAYGMMLMVPERTSLSASFENASHSLLEGMSNSVTGKNVYDNSSKHVEGFVAFCQYLVLESGEYEVSYSIDVANADEDNIGHLDVCADLGATILYHEEINVKSNAEEKQTYTITYKFRVDETKSDVELRLFSYGNADIILKGIQYQKTND